MLEEVVVVKSQKGVNDGVPRRVIPSSSHRFISNVRTSCCEGLQLIINVVHVVDALTQSLNQ
jgi:hypothetical protein